MRGLAFALLALVALSAMHAPARAAEANSETAARIIRQFYADREYRPVWTADDKFNAKAQSLPAVLEGAKAQGLDPAVYGAARMQAVLAGDFPQTPIAWKQAELFWTYGLWEYAADLWGRTPDADMLASLVDGDIADNLAALEPKSDLYKALKARLADLDSAGADAPKRVHFEFGKKSFRPGMSHAQVPALRAYLAAHGGYDMQVPAHADKATLYDNGLAKAVSAFQVEHSLTDDGTIGPATMALLNRSVADERVLLVANLQRLREAHRRLREGRRIEVSIAQFMLTAYDDGREVMTMPVVVGQTKRQTISFRTEITGVRLNPTWTVPSTIKKEDFLPWLVKDPEKMMRGHPGVQVVHQGQSIDPRTVDWSQVPAREIAQLRFWRPAGEGNPLGFYRVIMENPYDIYLHDTNHPELFSQSYRAQSSGCVRVGRPEDLANFILSDKQGWNPQKTKDLVKKGRTVDVVIENKMPIYLDYLTAWFNHRDQLVLGVDVYGLDKPRYDALTKNGLTTQRNAQKILDRVTDILQPELQEAYQRDTVQNQSSN